MPVRTQAFVDKLVSTLEVAHDLRKRVLAAFEDMVKTHPHVYPLLPSEFSLTTRYRYAYKIALSSRSFCSVQLDPYKRSNRFIRLEFNPGRHYGWLNRVIQILCEAIPGFSAEQFLEDACVTRIDLAFDLRHISVDRIGAFGMLRRPYSGEYQTHTTRRPTGYVNAREIGQLNSNRYFVLYDKYLERGRRQIDQFMDLGGPTAAQLPPQRAVFKRTSRTGRHSGRTETAAAAAEVSEPVRRREVPSAPIKFENLRTSLTRGELRIQKWGKSFGELLDLDDPFAPYSLFLFDEVCTPSITSAERMAINAMRYAGAQAILSMENDARVRHRMRDWLRGHAPDWWGPQIWVECREEILKHLRGSAT